MAVEYPLSGKRKREARGKGGWKRSVRGAAVTGALARLSDAEFGRMRSCLRWICVLLTLAYVVGSPAWAGANTSTENAISQIMIQSMLHRSPNGRSAHPSSPSAFLPQVGNTESEGVILGFEYANRDFTSIHLTGTAAAIYAMHGQRAFDGSLLVPELFPLLHRPVLNLVQLEYFINPTQKYFGLGNNDVGSHPLSTNAIERYTALETLGWRLTPRLTLALTVGFNHVRISRGVRDDAGDPFTPDVFPNLAGVHGGTTNPVSLAVIYDDRDNLTQPSRGWNAFMKVQHVGPELASDYRYTRLVFSGSYLFPVFNARHILGLRLRGQYVDASAREVPFYELPSLGGDQNMEGFQKDRFRGQASLLFSMIYREELTTFNFRNIWNVRLDGVLFGDAGRVFINARDWQNQFRVNRDLVPRLLSNFRYDYGTGLRIALGQVLVARLDVGFSAEESGLFYLSFGQIF